MKNYRKTTLVFALIVVGSMLLTYCRQDDLILGTTTTASTSELTSLLTTSTIAFSADNSTFTLDDAWTNAPKLQVTATVPDPGNYQFAGYVGKTYDVTLRSLYDKDNVYFLMEWNDPTQSLATRPWYFDKTTHKWAQEPSNPLFDTLYTNPLANNGVLVRNAVTEDKIGFLWNIDHSTAEFDTKTCYASCHIGAPTFSTSTGAATTTSNHWTNNINEKIDMWHIHMMQDLAFAQGSDEFQDWGVTYNTKMTPPQYALNGQGRHADYKDAATIAAGGPAANSQNLTPAGASKAIAVPKWVIPSETNSHFIKVSETVAGGRAVQVKTVDTLGVLTLADGTKIDPNVDDSYIRPVDASGKLLTDGLAKKWIPGRLIDKMTGGRGDLVINATYTGTGWQMKIKRALNTGSTLKQDVNFSGLEDQPFGIAVFNNANNQHALRPNLLLKFKK
jgi:hypothetical protein